MYNPQAFDTSVKAFKEYIRMIETHLGNKLWLVADRMTFADLITFVVLNQASQLVIDPGFRRAVPFATIWFQRVAA